uniref:Uncharacterized protein n=1 Tax=Acrobeloides nanus TaxID=290746 RepID=A0A914ECE2_9BILA
MINIKYLTPMPSLIIVGVFSTAMLAISDIYALINYLAFAETAVVTMAVAGLIVMRWTRPDMKRPIKVNFIIPILFVIMCLFILITPFVPIGVEQKSPIELIISLSIIVSGVPIYYLFVAWKDKPKSIYQIWINLTRFIQKLFYCVPDEEHDD